MPLMKQKATLRKRLALTLNLATPHLIRKTYLQKSKLLQHFFEDPSIPATENVFRENFAWCFLE